MEKVVVDGTIPFRGQVRYLDAHLVQDNVAIGYSAALPITFSTFGGKDVLVLA